MTVKSKRVLVSLPPEIMPSLKRLLKDGVSNVRFGGGARSMSEVLRRLIIEGLERHEGKSP